MHETLFIIYGLAIVAGIFLGYILPWILCVKIGKEKNRNGFLWGILGWFGLLIIAILQSKETSKPLKNKDIIFLKDSPSIGFSVLSFFLPIIGLGLFLRWKKSNPNKAKFCGRSAIIGFFLLILLNVTYRSRNNEKSDVISSQNSFFSAIDKIQTNTRDPIPYAVAVDIILGFDDLAVDKELVLKRSTVEAFIRDYFRTKLASEILPANEYMLKQEIIEHLNTNVFDNAEIKTIQFNKLEVDFNSKYLYKDYTLRMSISEVKTKSTDLKIVSASRPIDDIAKNALMFLHYSQLVSKVIGLAPDPMKYESGIVTKYLSEQNDLYFYFHNDQLIAVELRFWMANIISDLERQYGKVDPISWLNGLNKTATWDKDLNRIIYWFSTGDTEWVTYIDKNWLKPLINKAMEVYENEQANTRSKLD